MGKLAHLSPQNVFGYFEALAGIPHGSGNMESFLQATGLETIVFVWILHKSTDWMQSEMRQITSL